MISQGCAEGLMVLIGVKKTIEERDGSRWFFKEEGHGLVGLVINKVTGS